VVLEVANFSVGADDIVGVVAPSGAGRMTLLKVLVGASQPPASVAA
jgi:ABC-type nitrate/sulfonate/bicarbonate transport system ATPase subunit